MSALAELNRELIGRYLAGDSIVLDRLCQANADFIADCSGEVCRKYNCRHLEEDLISVGTLAFLEQLDEYDLNSDATLTTYLYPHIIGAMRREVEATLGCMKLPKYAFQRSRAVYALYKSGHSTQEIAVQPTTPAPL